MNIKSPANFFNYFKDCYKLDHKEFTVKNILNPKYKFKWFNDKTEELINFKTPISYYDNKNIEKLEKELLLYKLEKSLYYAAFYFIGKEPLAGLSKDPVICSPLVLFPCEIVEKGGDKFIQIDSDDFILNTSFLSKITTNSELKDKLETKLTQLFSNKIDDSFEIKKTLDQYGNGIDTSELVFYPQNWTTSKIRKYLKKYTTGQPFKIVPASGTIFIEKSISSTKIVSDLSAIAKNNDFGNPLEQLFDKTVEQNLFSKSYLENRLNTEQFTALKNSQEFNNSIIIGPPGTGKSYSISAMAVDAILKNKSVLIVSKTKQAVEVIKNNLMADYKLNDLLIHTSGNRFKISLEAKIKKKLSGIVARNSDHLTDIHNLHYKAKEIADSYEKLVAKELKLSELSFKNDLSFKEHIKKIFLKITKNNNLDFIETLSDLNTNSDKLSKELKNYVSHHTKKISTDNLQKNRSSLAMYYQALISSSFSESQHIIDQLDFTNVLEIFPLWLAHLSELNTVFPQKKELFDLVIIDEATQCDIATALPAIYRAKKVVVCGDPNQLRHYSFVGKKQQVALQKKYKLPSDSIFNYRETSILDLYLNKISNQKQLVFLREHYRSTPSLIAFNNKEFYNHQLEIIKSTTEFTSKKQLEIHYTNGTRDTHGINEIEAKKVLEKLAELIAKYKTKSNTPSLGVITPFSDQSKYINKLISNTFDIKTIKRFDILCGTPYHFQGSEREIILISFVVCSNTHHAAFTHLNKSEVLNVGTTRAKSYQYIYTSVDQFYLNEDSLFARYLNFIENYTYQHSENDAELDLYQQEVSTYLNSIEIVNIQAGYPYAGAILDLFFTHNNKHYFIDLIGYPGKHNDAFPIERYKTFNRVGINTVPLHYRFWKDNNLEAKKILQKLILKK